MFAASRRQFISGAAVLIAAPAVLRAQDAGPLRIGMIQTLSGPAGEPGRDQVIGARLAVDRFNGSGGWKGRRAELIVRDDKLNANDGVAATRELAGDGVNLMLGSLFSGPAIASIPLLKPLNIVYMVASPTAMSLTHELYVPNFFRANPNAYMTYRAQAQVIAQRFSKVLKWSAIMADTQATRGIHTSFSNGIKAYYRQMHGQQIEILEPIVVKLGTTEFRNHIGTLLSSGAEGFLLDISAGDALTFLQQARPFGFFDKMKAIADISLNVNLGRTLKKNTPRDVWSVTTWHERGYRNNPLTPVFVTEVQKAINDPVVNQYHAQGHAGMTMLLEAVRKADSSDTAAVIAALETQTFDTVYGPMGFRKEDHQAFMNPGVISMAPADNEQGWEVTEFVTVPWQDAIEPAGPGTPFVET